LITQVAGDCLLLCRDARDGFDKLSSEARKQSLEGARRRWESSIALALSLQAPVVPVLPPSACTASSSSALSVHFPIDSSVAAASGSHEPSYPSTLPSPSSSLVVHGATASFPSVVSIDLLSNPVKLERGVGFGDGGDIVSHADPVSIKEEKEIGKEECNSNIINSSSSSSSIRGSASKDSCSNGNGSGSSSSSNSRALEALYPAITMKLEDMPVSACRVVNPFSRYCNPHVLSVTVSYHSLQFIISSNFIFAGWD
jgi:hypothetical protein